MLHGILGALSQERLESLIRSHVGRYSKLADWDYIRECAQGASGLQLIGNGDLMSFSEYNERLAACPELATVMLARGALIKPWLFTEVGLLSLLIPALIYALYFTISVRPSHPVLKSLVYYPDLLTS